MRKILFIIVLLIPTIAFGIEKADLVLVRKSESKLYLKNHGKVFKEYHVSFGANPKGPKQQKGDERTPEGKYILDYKNKNSSFYKAIHISYPSAKDIKISRKRGVSPGGQIMIHGQKNGFGWLSFIVQRFNWTDGCISLSNHDMDEVWNSVDVGTPIEIEP
jgi:murein L,D-transpeptidase YafK